MAVEIDLPPTGQPSLPIGAVASSGSTLWPQRCRAWGLLVKMTGTAHPASILAVALEDDGPGGVDVGH
jgi:hypothetical protein